jgi:aminoglycoside phosphotransferase (APT) family kinase protein
VRTNRNRIEFDNGVVRRYPIQSWDRENLPAIAQRQQSAHEAGLPVPAVLAVHAKGPHPHLVMQEAAGTPLMETSLSAVAQQRLGTEIAAFAARMRRVTQWIEHDPEWPALWSVLARVAPTPQCLAAAEQAARAPLSLVHGDLSGGNLLVTADGDLVAVLDWDGAALADPAMDWAALVANCPPDVVAQMRADTPEHPDLEHRAQVYLDTWPVQHDLWLAGEHPWLSGDRPLVEPRT